MGSYVLFVINLPVAITWGRCGGVGRAAGKLIRRWFAKIVYAVTATAIGIRIVVIGLRKSVMREDVTDPF